MFNDHKPGRELDGTSASAADDRLEDILSRVRSAGADVTLDERVPLFIDFNMEEVKIGDRRIVEFNLNKTEFQITRDVKMMRIGGAGHKKHLEEVSNPIIETKLKRRPETSDQWLDVDMDDMF
ncbi:hypothetical protein KBD59_01070 [Candidatus Gracilibacteria bacterium]|nr:hypothetical protein [Candidatus Gracilibacteria bacterium]